MHQQQQLEPKPQQMQHLLAVQAAAMLNFGVSLAGCRLA
jgi:hypothetical protein